MLHILWLIIKFILILLSVILGLVLLILLLILFCPVRYRARARKETASLIQYKEIEAEGRVSWIFGAIKLKAEYQQEHLFKEIYLFGIPILRLFRKIHLHKAKRSDASDSLEIEMIHQREKTDFSESSDLADSPDTTGITGLMEKEAESEEVYQEIHEKGQNFFYKLGYKIHSTMEKIKKILRHVQKIPVRVHETTEAIHSAENKIKWWSDFLNHPRVRTAIILMKTSGMKLLKHIFPTKLTGKIIFGTTDPSVTGRILAILGMTMPLHKNCIQVLPVFEDKNILKGYIELRGRVYGFVLVKTAIQLYFDKNIKYVMQRWQHR